MAVLGNNIYISVGVGTSATIIAGTKTNSIKVGAEMIEVSSPLSDKWKEFIAGRNEWSFTVGYLVLQDSQVLDLLNVGTKVNIQVVGRNGTSSVVLLQGEAWIKTFDMNLARNKLAQGSCSFQGTGPLTAPNLSLE